MKYLRAERDLLQIYLIWPFPQYIYTYIYINLQFQRRHVTQSNSDSYFSTNLLLYFNTRFPSGSLFRL